MNKTVDYIRVFHPTDDCYTFFDGNENNVRYYYHKPSNNMTEYERAEYVMRLTDDCNRSEDITKDEWLRFKNKMSLIASSIRVSLPEDYRNKSVVYMPSADCQHMFMVRTIDDTFIVKRYMISKEAIYNNIIPNNPVLEERINRYFNELLNCMQVFINKIDIRHEQDS